MQFVNIHPALHYVPLMCTSYCKKFTIKTIAWGFAQKSAGALNNIYLKNKMYWGFGALELGAHLGEISHTCRFALRSARSATALGVS